MVSFCPGSPRVSKLVAIALSLFCVAGLLAAAEKKEETTPPRAQWIVVKEVAEEGSNCRPLYAAVACCASLPYRRDCSVVTR